MSLTHGMRYTSEYGIWSKIRERCENPKSKTYSGYGGRGITVCTRWLKFENFFTDMGPRPSSDHSIDRINNHGNYEPGNCRWATRSQQQRNRRDRPRYSLNGITLTQAEWAERYGVGTRKVGNRIRRGWDIRAALETP